MAPPQQPNRLLKSPFHDRLLKKVQMQGAQVLRNEAHFRVRRSDEGCGATPQMGLFQQPAKFSGCLLCLSVTLLVLWLPSTVWGAERMAEVTADKARVRSGPGTGYPVVTTLSKGEKLAVLSTSDDWCRLVLPGGKEGWIHKQLVDIREKGEKPGFGGTALENVRAGFGRGVDTVRTAGQNMLAIGESQSASGGRMLDDVEREDVSLQEQGVLKVDYAAVDGMDAAPPVTSGDLETFLRAGRLAPEKRP